MKRLIWVTLFMAGCSGPIALNRAIHAQDRAALEGVRASSAVDSKAAWIGWEARAEGMSVADAQAADDALSATRNPFDARKDADAVSRGALIFETHCAPCHGRDARGHGPAMLAEHPTKDFHAFGERFAVTLHGGAPRSWFRKITEGHGPEVSYPTGRSRAMPAFGDKLAREQVWLVITYLQSLDVYAKPDPQANGG